MANDLHDLCFIMGTFICLLYKYFFIQLLWPYHDATQKEYRDDQEILFAPKSVVKEKHNIYAIKCLILILKWVDTVSIVFPQWKIRKFEYTVIHSHSNSLYCPLNFFFFVIVLPTSAGSSKKQKSSRKTSISALFTMPNLWLCGSQ